MENDRLKQPKLYFDDAEFEQKEILVAHEQRSIQHNRAEVLGAPSAQEGCSDAVTCKESKEIL